MYWWSVCKCKSKSNPAHNMCVLSPQQKGWQKFLTPNLHTSTALSVPLKDKCFILWAFKHS